MTSRIIWRHNIDPQFQMDIREAAYCGNMERVQNLVEDEGVDINQRNPINGWTGTFKMQIRYYLRFAALELQI